jgi:hypothetical protein
VFCPGCGTSNDDKARFCLRCGRQLYSDDAASDGPRIPAIDPLPETLLQHETPLPALPSLPDPLPTASSLPLPASLPAQVVLGNPKRELPRALIGVLVAGVAAIAGIAYGVISVAGNLDIDSLPIVGNGGLGGSSASILVSLTSACKDSAGRDCNLIWDITNMRSDEAGLRLEYEVRGTGQAGCVVAIQADQAIIAEAQRSGRPGPFAEGARGRYYQLRNSEGITQAGGNLNCDQAKKGAWVFGAVTGESFVKLRYPGIPPARIDFEAGSIRPLSATDPLSVIPVQQTNCRTTQNQNCTGLWEIGPYGLAGDGTPILYFAVRFDGPAECQVPWERDVTANQALVAAGQRGIGLELAGNSGFLPLTSGGGISQQDGPLKCGTVLTGFWRFTGGNVTSSVSLAYPDFPVVQIAIRP